MSAIPRRQEPQDLVIKVTGSYVRGSASRRVDQSITNIHGEVLERQPVFPHYRATLVLSDGVVEETIELVAEKIEVVT